MQLIQLTLVYRSSCNTYARSTAGLSVLSFSLVGYSSFLGLISVGKPELQLILTRGPVVAIGHALNPARPGPVALKPARPGLKTGPARKTCLGRD